MVDGSRYSPITPQSIRQACTKRRTRTGLCQDSAKLDVAALPGTLQPFVSRGNEPGDDLDADRASAILQRSDACSAGLPAMVAEI